jgi:hypothetical protein
MDGRYGTAPKDLGLIDLKPTEMMFWLYLPIKLPGRVAEELPKNLMQFSPIIDAAYDDLGDERWYFSYVYLTVKTLHVSKDSPGNRPGWHSDGYMTDDLNYIWSDKNPTEFWVPKELRNFTPDHKVALHEMGFNAEESRITTYPTKHLLRLDETVIHRVAPNVEAGVRTFVKVSISDKPYDLIGNSINHELLTGFTYSPRSCERNHPSSN